MNSAWWKLGALGLLSMLGTAGAPAHAGSPQVRTAPFDHGVVCDVFFHFNHVGLRASEECDLEGRAELARQGVLQAGGTGTVCVQNGSPYCALLIPATPVPVAARALVRVETTEPTMLSASATISGTTAPLSTACLTVHRGTSVPVAGSDGLIATRCETGPFAEAQISLDVDLPESDVYWISIGVRGTRTLTIVHPAGLTEHRIEHSV